MKLHHDFLLYGGDAISADELLSKNTDVAECRFAVIARKFLDGDYAGAAAFLEQTYDWDAAQSMRGIGSSPLNCRMASLPCWRPAMND